MKKYLSVLIVLIVLIALSSKSQVPVYPGAGGGGGGSGTVTSVTFTGDGTILSATPSSAVTTSGTVTASLLTQSANCFLAGPTTGAAANPTCRALVNADFPGTLAPTFSGANLTSLPAQAFSALTGGTNTAAAMIVGTGSSLAVSGSGTISATSSTIATNLSGGPFTTATPAASTAGLSGCSSLFTGGTGTTTFPCIYLKDSGASAITTFSTGGTYISVNAASTFVGNFMDLRVNNGSPSLFLIGPTGAITARSFISNFTDFSLQDNTVKFGSGVIQSWSSTAAYSGTNDTGIDRSAAGVLEVNLGTAAGSGGSIKATGIIGASYQQTAASSTGGTCAMSTSTSCTITIGHTYTTPVCIATQQSATLTGGAVGCTVSGTTVTITSAVANSETWGAWVFGNPT